jgi:hypothetical protein
MGDHYMLECTGWTRNGKPVLPPGDLDTLAQQQALWTMYLSLTEAHENASILEDQMLAGAHPVVRVVLQSEFR